MRRNVRKRAKTSPGKIRHRRAKHQQASRKQPPSRPAGRVAHAAHDINNQLTVIKAYCDLLLADPKIDQAVRGQLEEISRAAERAAELARRLLASGRSRRSD